MTHHFDNLVDAISQINTEGYLLDFEILPINKIQDCKIKDIETVFIEGDDSSAETSTMVYLIDTFDGHKGFLISPHSIYKDDKVENIESILLHKFSTNGTSN